MWLSWGVTEEDIENKATYDRGRILTGQQLC